MQQQIDKIIKSIKFPVYLNSLSVTQDEYCLAESANEGMKIFFYLPFVVSKHGVRQLISDKKGVTQLIAKNSSIAIQAIEIVADKKELIVSLEDQDQLLFGCDKNKWRIYKKQSFHIECFEGVLEIW